MTMLALRMLLSGWASKLWGWLCHRSFWQLVSLGLAIALGIQTLRLSAEQRHARKVETQLSKSIAARKADQDAYRKAQSDAADENKAHVAKVEQQSRKVSDDERQAYLSDLAKLRADDQRLRGQVAAAQGSALPASPPAPPVAASGTDADGLHLPASEHLQAAEIELRLMHLQRWIEQQLTIDPNKP